MKPYLIFNLHDIKYGIDPILVKEIFLLPELMPLAETPVDIMGILNLRGKVIPVMHLDLRLGNPVSECHLNDNMIILDWQDLQIGIIVNTVQEVINIDSEQIQTDVDYRRSPNSTERSPKVNPAFISGIAKVDDEMIVLLNPEALIRQPDAVANLVNQTNQLPYHLNGKNPDLGSVEREEAESKGDNAKGYGNFYQLCCPHATSEEREVFHQRAEALAEVVSEESSETTEQIPLAVVSLDNEYFGIDLATVREFANVRSFTPIPCCPKHIIGNMNLRGEILTLVDIRDTLNLNLTSVKTGSKAVVVEVDEIVAGLPVDEVLDVMYVNSEEVKAIPMAVAANSEYFQGNTSYLDQIITILDLSKLMTKGDLVVNETV